MSAPKRYNGHHCWNCWNVALWIGNDEGLYRMALDYKREARNVSEAARGFIGALRESATCKHEPETPDGARYTFKAVRSALAGLES